LEKFDMKANMSRQFGSGGILASLLLLLTLSGCGGSGSDGEEGSDIVVKGPQFSLDVETFCGDPAMVPIYDVDGAVIGYEEGLGKHYENVAVRLTDVSDDNGPADPEVGLLKIECTAAVKDDRGKPTQTTFATILIPTPGFGVIETKCPLGSLPDGATEWKASATASDGDVRRDVFDYCEEIAAQ
jgi:hypothetical protein